MKRHIIQRIGALTLMTLFVLVSMGQACSKTQTPKKKTDPKTTEPKVDATPTKPTNKGKPPTPADGSLQPKDVGPKAPALMMMTGLKGYTEPCGCTLDIMLGGLDRIVGYVDAAKKLYPQTVMVDGGNVLFEESPMDKNFEALNRRKAKLVMQAHKRLGTAYTVPGSKDFALGVEFYQQMISIGGMKPLGANISIGGKALDPHTMLTLGKQRVGLIGLADPALYKEVKGIKVEDAKAAALKSIKALKAKKPDAYVVLFHGKAAQARELLKGIDVLDFVLVGVVDRETDQADQINKGYTLEPYDQGRYVGILKLYPKPKSGDFVNARQGSKKELETVRSQIEYVEQSINKLPPAAPGQEGPLLKRLRTRLQDLKRQEKAMKVAKIDVPKDKSSFLWRAVPMEPGLPIDGPLKKARETFNRETKKDIPDIPIPKVKAGQAFYVGATQCKTCHLDAYNFWAKTNHGHAFDTLVKRDKDYDPKCVGCHMVGYEKPGGSVVGKWKVDGVLNGDKFTKDLRHVGCENCHGPGSNHIESVMKGNGPKHITRQAPETTCTGSCHVPEHSPRFNYKTYLPQIIGPGHGKPMK